MHARTHAHTHVTRHEAPTAVECATLFCADFKGRKSKWVPAQQKRGFFAFRISELSISFRTVLSHHNRTRNMDAGIRFMHTRDMNYIQMPQFHIFTAQTLFL